MNRGILLPGQGAQAEGMGLDWAEAYPVARDTFAEADEILGFALSEKCWRSGDEVNRTDVAQPGIFTTSVAILRSLETEGLKLSEASVCAGLSLGEYTALWCTGSIDFADCLRLVRVRGEAMQAAAEAIPSSMVSLMGADEATARQLAELGSAAGICSVANLNAPGQVIVSGELSALEVVEAKAKEHGVRRATRLTVAGGFHSECMRPAAERLVGALAEVQIREPQTLFLSNVNGGPVSDPAIIREQLAQQVCAPVLWEKSMRHALEQGITTFLEPGPGQILGGIMRKIDKTASVESAAKPSQAP
ncbi:MAG: [acyl-carrier-protein] S-malonyltransferase [Candidatus Paceibacteria bacterium]|jgi:[acyl-carrier-protein] S-malonyltransferase